MKRNIIIDTDPGIDDALALLLALFSKKLSIKAVSAVFGNVDVDLAFDNIRRIFSISRIRNLPNIAKGAKAPLSGQTYKPRLVHGINGLGNAEIKLKDENKETANAAEAIKKVLSSEDIDLLITLGPLTNIATLLIEEPAIKNRIKEMVVMGGSVFISGNATEEAEFNFFQDPEAAKVVFNSKIPIRLISLDASRQVLFESDIFRAVEFKDSDMSRFIKQMIDFGLEYHKKYHDRDGVYLPDVLAMAAVMEPEAFEYQQLSLDIDIDKNRGKVFDNLQAANSIKFCNKVDRQRIVEMLVRGINEIIY
jgi:inosine-uridine nucleoside N-ribohydrolase